MMQKEIFLTLVCFNEAEGVEEFFSEICEALPQYKLSALIVDDFSNDATPNVLKALTLKYGFLKVYRNPQNLGHGPSTLIGLKNAMASGAEYIVAIDGDGQFFGADIAAALDHVIKSDAVLLEGVRSGRDEPIYRKIVSFVTRIIVLSKGGSLPKDANTPFRIYHRKILRELLSKISNNSKVPNLEMSIYTRRMALTFTEFPVRFRTRRGEVLVGTTWQSKGKFIPSLRFLKFCTKAFKSLISI